MLASDHSRRYRRPRYHRPVHSPGLFLILLGVALLFLQGLGGALTPLLLGGIFTAVAFGAGRRGLLIPGGILLGIGLGSLLAATLRFVAPELASAASVAGLGAGFWFIYLADRARSPFAPSFGWARIPGTILLAIAALQTLLGLGALTWRLTATLAVLPWRLAWSLGAWWPVLLIVAGLALVIGSFWQRRGR